MTLGANMLAILACPSCKGKLIWNQDKTELVCCGEQLAYPVENGIPALLASSAREVSVDELEQIKS
ncbi:MAG: Trm112 family protein [Aliidiomarina sp.]|uniref:Trm112 family protein n=1 Tax=Aliidiomarina sp. TaxID=1872439 RepID=UPI0025C066C0|nr:Trm112 family protein [Aliidiomarina sp.]MCH8500508.1 Trm112 family protein [Aliidiomarina sp.]